MKKLFLVFMSYILCLTSCTQIEETSSNNQTESLISVNEELNELRQFNDSIRNYATPSCTRSWWGNLLTCFSADMIGACSGYKISVKAAAFITAATEGTAGVGAGIGVLACTGLIAGGSSYRAYSSNNQSCGYAMTMEEFLSIKKQKIKPCINAFNSKCKYTDKLNETLIDDKTCDVIATLHDSIVYISLNNDHISTTRTINPIETDEYKCANNDFDIKLFSNEEIESMNKKIDGALTSYYSTGDYQTTLQNMINNGLISIDSGNIIIALMEALNLINEDKSQLDTVLNKYKEVVINSNNLSIEDKNSILIGLSVADNSFTLWTNQLNRVR